MILTDYTEKSTLPEGFGQQYRIVKYIKDIINNFFADSRNIKDQRILSLMYNRKGDLNKDCIKVGCPFDPDSTYAGTTPAVVVGVGDISYSPRHINEGGNPQFASNPMKAPIGDWRIKNIPVIISVLTQSYDGTLLLTQLIQMFLTMNSNVIRQDCNNINAISVQAVSSIKEVPMGSTGNAKQLYMSNISMSIASVLSWTCDTQGPVFKGVNTTNNFK